MSINSFQNESILLKTPSMRLNATPSTSRTLKPSSTYLNSAPSFFRNTTPGLKNLRQIGDPGLESRPNSLGIFQKIQSLFFRQVPPDTDPVKFNVNILSEEDFYELKQALLRKNAAGELIYTDRDFICSPRWFKTIKSCPYLQELALKAKRTILLEKINQSP